MRWSLHVRDDLSDVVIDDDGVTRSISVPYNADIDQVVAVAQLSHSEHLVRLLEDSSFLRELLLRARTPHQRCARLRAGGWIVAVIMASLVSLLIGYEVGVSRTST